MSSLLTFSKKIKLKSAILYDTFRYDQLEAQLLSIDFFLIILFAMTSILLILFNLKNDFIDLTLRVSDGG